MTARCSRRNFLFLGLATALALGGSATLVSAQPARRRARRQLRRIRRRAIQRYRQRGGLPVDAREAVRRGDVRPLRDVLALVRRRSDAEVLDVDLYRRPQGWVYAMRVLTAQGRVRDVFLDARSLKPLRIGRGTRGPGVPLPRDLPPLGEPSGRPSRPLPRKPRPIAPHKGVPPR